MEQEPTTVETTPRPRPRVLTNSGDTEALSVPPPEKARVPVDKAVESDLSTNGEVSQSKVEPLPIFETVSHDGLFEGRNIITRKEVMQLFSKSELTIMKWQVGKGLPFIRIPGTKRDTIRFDKEKVIEWGKANGKL